MFLKTFVRSQLDLPVYLIWLVVSALMVDFSSVTNGLMVVADDESEDEFAEFEDPDDTFSTDLSDQPPGFRLQNSASHSKASSNENRSHRQTVNVVDQPVTPSTPKDSQAADSSEDIPLVPRKPIPLSEEETRLVRDQQDGEYATVESDEFENVPFRDDEEFEDSPLKSETPKTGSPNLIMAKLPRHLTGSWDSYRLEIFIVTLLTIYFINFLIGRTKNTELSLAWFEAHKPLFESQFAMVGDDGQAEPGTGTLVKESEHLYSLWCSGRIHCEAMLIELRLLKRQCLLYTLINWLHPAHDTLLVKLIMEDNEMDGWVLAVGRKRSVQQLTKDHQDLAFFCPEKRSQHHPGLPDSLIVSSEIPEATSTILNGPICKFLSDHEQSIDYLFFSDQYTGPKPLNEDTNAPVKITPPQKVLFFSFRIGNKGSVTTQQMEATTSFFQFIFYTVEKVHRFRLGKESKMKSEKNRQRAHDTRLKAVHSQRQEAAQSRREERLRANKERIMTEEDPEKARKLEEREQRKEKAKKMPKMKMIKTRG